MGAEKVAKVQPERVTLSYGCSLLCTTVVFVSRGLPVLLSSDVCILAYKGSGTGCCE